MKNKTNLKLSISLVITTVFVAFASLCSAQQFGVVFANNVNVRKDASSKAPITAKIEKNLSIVNIEWITNTNEEIFYGDCSIKHNWIEISSGEDIKGFIYGAYIIAFNTADSAQDFIAQNHAFRKTHIGKYTLTYPNDGFPTYYEFEFFEDGSAKFSLNRVEGDHITSETSTGRFYVNTKNNTFNFYGSTEGEFAPDGYTWAEYFALANGHEPTKAELEMYIKEQSHYKCYCEVKDIPMEDINQYLLPIDR